MAKKDDSIERKVKHPEPDTSANEGKDGQPPPTWNQGKATQPAGEDE